MSLSPTYAAALKRSLSIPCVLIEVVQVEFDHGLYGEIEIVEGKSRTSNCIGIHLLEPEERDREDAIESCIRNGFERIYIYRGAK